MMATIEKSTQQTWTTQEVQHLLGRIELAIAPSRVQRFTQMTCLETVDAILREAAEAPLPQPPSWVQEPWVNTERRYADTTPEEFRGKHGATNRRYREETADLRRWWFAQMVDSPVPLREVMTLFWHGHFASSIGKVLISQAMYHQNAKQRQLAVGNFRDLLREMVLDGAMMIYLDLEDSDRKSPNENFARELFELFALGVDNYDQADIREAARALSGLILDAPEDHPLPNRPTDPTDNRRFTRDGITPRLDPALHDAGSKTIFGTQGRFGVEEVIELTVSQPTCGPFLAGKLIDYFGVDDPQGAVQARMADAFQVSGFEISAMLRVLWSAPEFYSPESRGKLIKSPLALLAGACRQLEAKLEFTPGINRYTTAMGQELFNPPNVKGWPGGKTWIGSGTLALRYHLADVLLDSQEPSGMSPLGRDRGRPVPVPKDPQQRRQMLQRMAGGPPDGAQRERGASKEFQVQLSVPRLFPEGIPEEPEELIDTLLQRMLSIAPRASLRAAALEVATRHPGQQRVTEVVRLILATPDYQIA